MYNVKNNNLNEPMTDMFEISNNEFHNLRSNAVLKKVLATLGSGVTRALIGGGGGGVYSYIRVLPDGFLLK